MNHQELLSTLKESRSRFTNLLFEIPEQRMEQVHLANGWSLKDLCIHIWQWEKFPARLYEALVLGKTPDHPENDEQVNQINAKIQADFAQMPVAQVLEEEERTYQQLLAWIQTVPEEDLFTSTRFAWTEGREFYYWILWNSAEHYDEHLADLQAAVQRTSTDQS